MIAFAIAEVFIHDPEYFVMTFNLAAIPHIKNVVNFLGIQIKKDKILIISVPQHMNLNKPEKVCEYLPYAQLHSMHKDQYCIKNWL